jgi:hypothetical protein
MEACSLSGPMDSMGLIHVVSPDEGVQHGLIKKTLLGNLLWPFLKA